MAPPLAPPGVMALLVGAAATPPGGPPNRDDMISPNGLACCVRGGGMAKYTVAISFKACELEWKIKLIKKRFKECSTPAARGRAEEEAKEYASRIILQDERVPVERLVRRGSLHGSGRSRTVVPTLLSRSCSYPPGLFGTFSPPIEQSSALYPW